jgi:hypothetical protein
MIGASLGLTSRVTQILSGVGCQKFKRVTTPSEQPLESTKYAKTMSLECGSLLGKGLAFSAIF